MAKYAFGTDAKGVCDVCGFVYKLRELKEIVSNRKRTGIKACRRCWVPDQPQNFVGERDVIDPQALRDPRPDTNTLASSRAVIIPIPTGAVGTGFIGRVTVE